MQYYYSPYNRTLNFNKHMDFNNDTSINSNRSKWKIIYNLLRQEKEVLRKSLIQINNALYIEFENVAKWAMNKANNNFIRRTKNISQMKPNSSDNQTDMNVFQQQLTSIMPKGKIPSNLKNI